MARRLSVVVGLLALAVTACSAEPKPRSRLEASAPSPEAGSGGLSSPRTGAAAGSGATGSGASSGNPSGPLIAPAPPPADQDAGPIQVPRDDCGKLKLIVRDFQIAHPDFERDLGLAGLFGNQGEKGLLQPQLEKGYPAYAYSGTSPGGQIEGPASFRQWYVDDASVNKRFEISLPFTEDMPGHFVYDSAEFFPIDNLGWGNEGNPHNYHFTTEVRTEVTYQGGEVFTFRGDDDLWMFINDQLVIDLGGAHPPQEASVSLDAEATRLGLTRGETYPMAIFHAERHTTGSNYRIETNISCFVAKEPPPPPDLL